MAGTFRAFSRDYRGSLMECDQCAQTSPMQLISRKGVGNKLIRGWVPRLSQIYMVFLQGNLHAVKLTCSQVCILNVRQTLLLYLIARCVGINYSNIYEFYILQFYYSIIQSYEVIQTPQSFKPNSLTIFGKFGVPNPVTPSQPTAASNPFTPHPAADPDRMSLKPL